MSRFALFAPLLLAIAGSVVYHIAAKSIPKAFDPVAALIGLYATALAGSVLVYAIARPRSQAVEPSRLAVVEPSWSYLLDVRAGRERALEPFRRMSSFVDPAEKEIVNDLMTIRMEKMDLDVHYSLQGVLRSWLIVHVPPAAVLMALLVVHILAWALY